MHLQYAEGDEAIISARVARQVFVIAEEGNGDAAYEVATLQENS